MHNGDIPVTMGGVKGRPRSHIGRSGTGRAQVLRDKLAPECLGSTGKVWEECWSVVLSSTLSEVCNQFSISARLYGKRSLC